MVLSTQQPIERRPMTSKQARKRWQKKGGTTISSSEQRRRDREALLLSRAEEIKTKEKRKKELATKRKEKEERNRETRKQMGYQEEIKLPEGQLGLGQFFSAKTTGNKSKTSDAQQDMTLPVRQSPEKTAQLQPGIEEEGSDIDSGNEDEDEDDDCDSDAEDVTTTAVQREPHLIKMLSGSQQQSQPYFVNLPKPSRVDERRGKPSQQALEMDGKTSGQLPFTQEAQDTSQSGGAAADNHAHLNTITPTLSQRKKDVRLAHSKTSLLSGEQIKRKRSTEPREPLSSIDPNVSETEISFNRSTSLPSSMSKRGWQQAGLDFDAELGMATEIAMDVPRKKIRTASLGIQRADLDSLRNLRDILRKPEVVSDMVISSQSSSKRKLTSATCDTDLVGAENEPRAAIQHEPDSFSNGLMDDDFDVLLNLGEQPKSSRPEVSVEDSRGIDDSRDSLELQAKNNSNAQEGNKLVALQTSQEESKRSSHSPHSKKSFSRTESTQSYGYDFSSQDYSDLEAIINASPVKDAPPSLLVTAKSTTAEPNCSAKTSSFEDDFDLPGCTQALAALADVEKGEKPIPTTRTAQNLQPKISQKASMPPPPLPRKQLSPPKRAASLQQRSALQSPGFDDADDVFSCFAGSTQALLDL